MSLKKRSFSSTGAPVVPTTTIASSSRVDSIVDSPGSTIDPVEKLLHLPCFSSDILESNPNTVTHNNVTYAHLPNSSNHQTRIRQLILARMRNCRGNFFDNLSFAILTKNDHDHESQFASHEEQDEDDHRASKKAKPSHEIPFFRNVNFNSRSTTFDEYFSYDLFEENNEGKIATLDALPMTPSRSTNEDDDDDDEDPISSPPISYTPPVSPGNGDDDTSNAFNNNNNNNNNNDNNSSGMSSFLATSKMSFGYRRKIDELLNLSMSASTSTTNSGSSSNSRNGDGVDVWKCLNNTCLLSGKASEMLGSGNIVLTDFLL